MISTHQSVLHWTVALPPPFLAIFLLVFNFSSGTVWVRVQMYPQNVYTRSCIITLIAFVWFFSTVCLQMSPYMWGCKVTLVATIWLLSSGRFQMCPQIACQRIGIYICPFPACVLNVYSKHLHKKIQSHNGCIRFICSPLCVFKCVQSEPKRM